MFSFDPSHSGSPARGTRRVLISLVVLSATSAACTTSDDSAGEGDSAGVSAVPADSASRVTMATSVGAAEGFKTPESVRHDAELDVYFVSNINGNPSQKDGNGFIARIAPDSSGSSTMLAEGGKAGVTLNAPKGLAIAGDTLWVTDIDVVRGFNKRTGRPVATVSIASLGATFLNDIAVGPDGALYITDTGVRFDASGGMTHPGKDRIFKITGRTPTVAFEGTRLSNPNGIAWDAANNRFLLAPFAGNDLLAWVPGDSAVTVLATGPGGYDGLEVLGDGRVLVSSWTDSTVSLVADGVVRPVVRGAEAPADIGFDTRRNRVLLPRFNAGRVEYWELPAR